MMDTISRQAVLDYCEALMNAERLQQTDDWGYGMERYNQTECIMQYIENMPPIQPKKGKWIDTGRNEEWYAREYRCSECGDTMLGEAKFCPNCGSYNEVDNERRIKGFREYFQMDSVQ